MRNSGLPDVLTPLISGRVSRKASMNLRASPQRNIKTGLMGIVGNFKLLLTGKGEPSRFGRMMWTPIRSKAFITTLKLRTRGSQRTIGGRTKQEREKRLPGDLRDAKIITIFKKRDKSGCSNYCGIALLLIAVKILVHILINRFTLLAESQCAFTSLRGTISALSEVHMIIIGRQL